MSFKPARRPHFFYTTSPLPCPYVPGRTERKVVTELAGVSAETLHDRLSRGGFRRSHNIAYAPVCPNCNACVPIRIRAQEFGPDRTQRRIERRNADLLVQEMPPRATAEQYGLFQVYQLARHGDGDMSSMSFYDYRAMVEDTPIETSMVEFRLPGGRLVGACLADRLEDGVSAVYSFFDTDLPQRSLGTYAIIWLVRRAVELRLENVYLGYWVEESRKMSYKAKFSPSEVLRGGQWRAFGEPAGHLPGLVSQIA
ncbi:arginyltransferase [Acidocella sp.]|uniref:arginyltransferase n=1 Tax=Acidocella sp. TaxID=50710 RepID=UPI00260B204A|nr:arginyltransferase [Acidocella sp.]